MKKQSKTKMWKALRRSNKKKKEQKDSNINREGILQLSRK